MIERSDRPIILGCGVRAFIRSAPEQILSPASLSFPFLVRFFSLNTNPEVLRFVPDKAPLNVEQAWQLLIDHPIADYQKYGFGRGACIPKSMDEQIGFAGLKYLEKLGEVDVAYRLLPAYWGRRLAT